MHACAAGLRDNPQLVHAARSPSHGVIMLKALLPRRFVASPAGRTIVSCTAAMLMGAMAFAQCEIVPGAGFDLSQSTLGWEVKDLVTLPNGGIVAAGRFDKIGGVSATNIARWNGSAWTAFGGAVDGEIRFLHVAPNGDLLATGEFNLIGGINAAGAARWDGASWTAVGNGMLTGGGMVRIQQAVVLANGDLIGCAGVNVYRWSGTAWAIIGTASSVDPVRLAAMPNGDLLMAGRFATVTAGGVSTAARMIARWQPATATWSPVGPFNALAPGTVVSHNSRIHDIVVRPDGGIEMGGAGLGYSNVVPGSTGYARATWNGAWNFSDASTGLSYCIALAVTTGGEVLAAFNDVPTRIDRTSAGATTTIGQVDAWTAVTAIAVMPGGVLCLGSDGLMRSAQHFGWVSVGVARMSCSGGIAAADAYGLGCYEGKASLYEVFVPTMFDLLYSTLRFDFDGYRYQVTHIAGTPAFISPTSPALPLGDDTLSNPIFLPFTIPYPGGSTNQLLVGSNGIVYLQPSADASAFYGNTPGLLAGAARWAPMWGDLDPAPSGGGSVHVEVQTSAQRVIVSWINMQEYGYATNTSTFQVVADASGDVDFRYLSTVSNLLAMTGWSPGNGAADPGSGNLSHAGPFECRIDSERLQHAAVGRPVLGATLALTTSSVPASSLLGATVLGLTQFPAGIDLAAVGMPGCSMFTSIDVVVGAVPSAPAFTYTLSVPNVPALVGYPLYSQGLALVMGQNAAGFVVSNAIAMTVGHI